MFIKNSPSNGNQYFILNLEDSMSDFLVKKISGKENKIIPAAIAVIVSSIILTSFLTVTALPKYVFSITVFPAGLGLFFLLYYFLEINKKLLTKYRENTLQKRRIFDTIILITVVLSTIVTLNVFLLDWVHTGVGATLAIVTAISSALMSVASREENYYKENNIVDPRE